MNEKYCKNCQHYIQHYYYKSKFRFSSIAGCGHCLLGKRKCSRFYCCELFEKGNNEFFRKNKEIDALKVLTSINYYLEVLNKLNEEIKK